MSAEAPEKPYKTINEMAAIAGVSARTLRYYESIGLLCPQRTDAGYRMYGNSDAKRLAHVIAMRSCGLPLQTIKDICQDPQADILGILKHHLAVLQKQHASTDAAMDRTKVAISAIERIDNMNVKDSFEHMKEEGLLRFEEEFGQEARERYGDETIDSSNQRMMALTKDEWDAKELLEESIKVQLRIAMATHDPQSEEAREFVRMHKKWIAIHWGNGFSEEAYIGLAHGYLEDPRFVNYYDSASGEGATEFLVQAVDAASCHS